MTASLTGRGAVVLASAVSVVGLLLGHALGAPMGAVFAVCYVGGCAAAALLVRRRDLTTVLFLPSLLFLVMSMLSAAISSLAPIDWGLSVVTTMATQTPVMVAASLLTLCLVAARRIGILDDVLSGSR